MFNSTKAGRISLTLPQDVSWKTIAAVIWLGFSLALAVWWIVFGLSQIERISELAGGSSSSAALEIARRHRMLISEGATLVILLLGGGIALLYHVRAEVTRARRLKEFFAAFTHDIKTSLASLRLQAESLEEDAKDSGHEKLIKRLVKDTVRLELQLENSLLLASPDAAERFLLEPIDLLDLLGPMSHHWPELRVHIKGSGVVLGDRRALESIFKNLFQNSVVHGRAKEMEIQLSMKKETESQEYPSHAAIRFYDNGRGFQGDLRRLGLIFERHGTSSGSGLGLYLVKNLTTQLGGEVSFFTEKSGFGVDLKFPGAVMPQNQRRG